MDGLRERFLKVYANLPLGVRDEIALVLDDADKIKKPLTWNVAFLEIKGNTALSERILKELDELNLI